MWTITPLDQSTFYGWEIVTFNEDTYQWDVLAVVEDFEETTEWFSVNRVEGIKAVRKQKKDTNE